MISNLDPYSPVPMRSIPPPDFPEKARETPDRPAHRPVPPADARRAAVLIIRWFLAVLVLAAGCRRRSLTIATTPPGAAVWVDGRPVGPAPVTVPAPKNGPITLRVTCPGYRIWERKFPSGALPASGNLQVILERRKFHTLVLDSSPEGAQVWLDGELRGRTPLTIRGLGGETAHLVLRRDGYAPVQRSVDLSAEKSETLHLAVAMKDRRETYYLERIAKSPDDLRLYADLAHEYAIQHQLRKAAAILERGAERALQNSRLLHSEPSRRLISEFDRILTRQFDYGDDAQVRKARACLAPALKRLVSKYPYGSPILYLEYALCLKLQGRPEQAEKIVAQAYNRFPRQRRILDRFARRLRARRFFP